MPHQIIIVHSIFVQLNSFIKKIHHIQLNHKAHTLINKPENHMAPKYFLSCAPLYVSFIQI